VKRNVVDPLSLRINEVRFRENFEALSIIGVTPEGGVNRPTFSEAHTKAREWFREQAHEAGLEIFVDGAANHSAILRQPGAEKTLIIGSHLDSVPNGGRFDGALGVVAALEILNTIKDADLQLPVHLEAVDFTDEESTYAEFLGSRAFTGRLNAETLQIRDRDLSKFKEALAVRNLSERSLFTCGRDPSEFVGYIELHIEQGSRLEESDSHLGIVTSIVGIYENHIIFHGRADHAGTTPMSSRLNAGLGASGFNLSLDQLVREQYPNCVANVGKMIFEPGAANVVPARVEVVCEYRAPNDQLAEALAGAIREAAQEEAERYGLELEIIPIGHAKPIQMNSQLQGLIAETAEDLGLKSMKLTSGAGHDAQILGNFTPSGMIFVPSAGGISHNPKEYSKWEDCVNGANVLMGSVIRRALQV
jgi:N-carbamoyl-L-amino-acid hydrolase